jgi:hypothetical protein
MRAPLADTSVLLDVTLKVIERLSTSKTTSLACTAPTSIDLKRHDVPKPMVEIGSNIGDSMVNPRHVADNSSSEKVLALFGGPTFLRASCLHSLYAMVSAGVNSK